MMATLATEFQCSGGIRLGSLQAATAQQMARVAGDWLELEGDTLVVRHIQPGGPPATTAIPSELIAYLDAIPPEQRAALPGGCITIRSREGSVLQVAVERGEIRIRWPHEDWTHAVPVDAEAVLASADPYSARVSGGIRLQAPAGAEGHLAAFVDSFEGLYPAGDLDVRRQGDFLHITLREANVGPAQLLAVLRSLAAPPSSLEADLEVGSFTDHVGDRDFRLTVRENAATAVRPSLWSEP